MRTQAGTRRALLGQGLGLLLVGCSDGRTAIPPPPSAPASVPASTEEPLVVPASATPATAQRAAEFARYHLQALRQAFQSGEVGLLKRHSHPECGTCANYVKITQEEVAQGLNFRGGAFAVESSEGTVRAPGDAVVSVVYLRGAAVTIDAADRVVASEEASPRRLMQLRLLRQGSTWSVRAIAFEKVPS